MRQRSYEKPAASHSQPEHFAGAEKSILKCSMWCGTSNVDLRLGLPGEDVLVDFGRNLTAGGALCVLGRQVRHFKSAMFSEFAVFCHSKFATFCPSHFDLLNQVPTTLTQTTT